MEISATAIAYKIATGHRPGEDTNTSKRGATANVAQDSLQRCTVPKNTYLVGKPAGVILEKSAYVLIKFLRK